MERGNQKRMHQNIVVGGGLAALVFAARLVELGKKDIGIYTVAHGATPYVAAINFVLKGNPSGDTTKQYAQDMMDAGYAISNRQLVEAMCDASQEGYELLKRWGVEFSLQENGFPRLRKTSGSSLPRSLCSTQMLIGEDIINKLTKGLEKNGVVVNTGCEALRLLKDKERVCGITVRNGKGEIFNVYSGTVTAAWGGVGGVLGTTTYPGDINGRMFAEAYEAGAQMVDMEFLEFEPLIVIDPPEAVGEPCPTAMLAEGAYLLNCDMERFILKERPEGESGASKTLINKAIWKELEQGRGTPNGGVYVDVRHIPEGTLKLYPWFYNRLKDADKDPVKELIEVVPMPHSISGGIWVDNNFQSNIEGLYAVGEAAGSLHGACRIGGNASSVAVLSAILCAEAVAKADAVSVDLEMDIDYSQDLDVRKVFDPEIKRLAADALGAFRERKTMLESYDKLYKMILDGELDKDTATRQNALTVLIMIKAALLREESRGVHLRRDFPTQRSEFERGLIIQNGKRIFGKERPLSSLTKMP